MQTEELYKEYAVLDLEYKRLETKREELRALILANLQSEKVDKAETSFGVFTVAKKIIWSFSQKIKNMEDKVKIAKDRAIKKGEATALEKEYLVFNQKKDGQSN